MTDLGRTKPARQPDADGTKAEDNRQLTELLMQNRVSLTSAAVETVDAPGSQSLLSRMKTWLILFLALPFALIAYFSTRTAEDDFYV